TRVSHHLDHAPSPHPAHRTVQADFPHTALGRDAPVLGPRRLVNRRRCQGFWNLRNLSRELQALANLRALGPLVPGSRTEAPSLPRHYSASTVLRASPPPPCNPACPSRASGWRSRTAIAGGFPCCVGSPCAGMLSPIPRRTRWVRSLVGRRI